MRRFSSPPLLIVVFHFRSPPKNSAPLICYFSLPAEPPTYTHAYISHLSETAVTRKCQLASQRAGVELAAISLQSSRGRLRHLHWGKAHCCARWPGPNLHCSQASSQPGDQRLSLGKERELELLWLGSRFPQSEFVNAWGRGDVCVCPGRQVMAKVSEQDKSGFQAIVSFLLWLPAW